MSLGLRVSLGLACTVADPASPSAVTIVLVGHLGSLRESCIAFGSTYSLHCSPFFGLTSYMFRILSGNPKKELLWQL